MAEDTNLIITKRCRARLDELADAVRGYISETGTSYDQDVLLFAAGFRDDCRAMTMDGTTVDLTRDEAGAIIADAPVEVLLQYEAAGGQFARVNGVGWVVFRVPSLEERTLAALDAELQSNATHFLPAWAVTAIVEEFTRRNSRAAFELIAAEGKKAPAKKVAAKQRGVSIGELPTSPVVDEDSTVEELLDAFEAESTGAVEAVGAAIQAAMDGPDSVAEAVSQFELACVEMSRAEEDYDTAKRVYNRVVKDLADAVKRFA